MITLKDYYMGRDETYKSLLTPQLRANASITVASANELLNAAVSAGIFLEVHPKNLTLIASGWRPPAVNSATPGAAPGSKHMTCEGIDIYDADGDLDRWCLENEDILEKLSLWIEHPSATKTWCHAQIVQYRSWVPGKTRFFYP